MSESKLKYAPSMIEREIIKLKALKTTKESKK